jgi:diguanylate cyclase (GGDEF)-like protein/putative nucleotidyltransferase with HDIG domain
MGVLPRKKELEDLASQLSAARRHIASLEQQLEARRTRDPLTGLPVVEVLNQRLGPEIERSRRHGRPLSVAVVDVDGFRAINAHFGRAIGDRVLTAIGKTLAMCTRASDVVVRSSADEFVVMMPETTLVDAEQAFDRILVELETPKVDSIDSLPISAGLAQWERGMTGEQLVALAGARVDVARSLGGGRVAAGDPPKDEHGAAEGAQDDVIVALAEALIERDRYTGEHSESVVELVESVARGLALSPREVTHIKAAALLHDIGKVAIPDHILNKPGPLDDEEWQVMREHPVVGERILRAIPGMGPIARIVRHEHERFDGSGYPDRIAGEEIPIGARIILACDAYHAMTSDRPYRKSMPYGDAIKELVEGAGTQFDPRVTEVLIGSLYGQRQAGGGLTEAETEAKAAAERPPGLRKASAAA